MSLRFAILGLLTQEELSGYEITKRFSQSVGYFWHARSQQIYPELARLEEEGHVEGRVVPQKGRPDKRLYTITPRGREELLTWVVSPSPLTLVKDEFLLKVWCYGLVDPTAAIGVLARHRQMHEERLARFEQIAAGVDNREQPMEDEHFGPYLTLLAGIAVERAFVDWAKAAEHLLAHRAKATPPAARASAPAAPRP